MFLLTTARRPRRPGRWGWAGCAAASPAWPATPGSPASTRRTSATPPMPQGPACWCRTAVPAPGLRSAAATGSPTPTSASCSIPASVRPPRGPARRATSRAPAPPTGSALARRLLRAAAWRLPEHRRPLCAARRRLPLCRRPGLRLRRPDLSQPLRPPRRRRRAVRRGRVRGAAAALRRALAEAALGARLLPGRPDLWARAITRRSLSKVMRAWPSSQANQPVPETSRGSKSAASPLHVLQEEVVDPLVDAPQAALDVPVFDPRQRRQHPAGDPGLLAHLAHRRLLGGLALLDVPLGSCQRRPLWVEISRTSPPRPPGRRPIDGARSSIGFVTAAARHGPGRQRGRAPPPPAQGGGPQLVGSGAKTRSRRPGR